MQKNPSDTETETLSDWRWRLEMIKRQIEDGKERVQAINDAIWIPRWKENEVKLLPSETYIIEKGFFECADFIINPTTMTVRGKNRIEVSAQSMSKDERGSTKKGVRALNAFRELNYNAQPNTLAKKLNVTISKRLNKTLAPYMTAARKILKEIESEYKISRLDGRETIELYKELTKASQHRGM